MLLQMVLQKDKELYFIYKFHILHKNFVTTPDVRAHLSEVLLISFY